MLRSAEIKQAALAVGFDACGVAPAVALTDEEYPLRQWLAKGWHGELAYMERNVDKRMDPRRLVEGAKSVICCVSAYPPPTTAGGVAAYARTREYHKVVKDMLFSLCDRLSRIQDVKFSAQNSKLCCDTVPISDKHWAARAGLGWIGRHTLLVTPRWGSWVNLGEIVTTEEFDVYDSPIANGCTDCDLCINACPNHAIGDDMIDVRRCTAYYTTHHARPMPDGIDPHGYTQGCDLCQLACPLNKTI